MIVFWALVIAICIAAGFAVCAFTGDKIYDATNKVKEVYTKGNEENEVKNEQ